MKSLLDYPNTDEGLRQYIADREAERLQTLAKLRRLLPALRASAEPCPFCGKQPTIGPTRPDLDGDAWGFVKCS